MKTSIGERLKQFMQYKGDKAAGLAAALGYSNAEKLNRLFRDKNAKPGYDTIMDIASYYPDLDMEWFLKGAGEMRRGTNKTANAVKGHIQGNSLVSVIKNSKLPGDQKLEMALQLLNEYSGRIDHLQKEMEVKNTLLMRSATQTKRKP